MPGSLAMKQDAHRRVHLTVRVSSATLQTFTMFDPDDLLIEFRNAADDVGLMGWPCEISCERLVAPHRQPQLRPGMAAVYAFSLSPAFGSRVPAGPGRVLKVGKAGGQSGPR